MQLNPNHTFKSPAQNPDTQAEFDCDATKVIELDTAPAPLKPDLVIDGSHPTADPAQSLSTPDISQKSSNASDNISDILRTVDCSSRLFDVITLNANHLPVNTVREYMAAPDYARQGFLRLFGLGQSTVNELDQIMHSLDPGQHHMDPGVEHAYQNALLAVEHFCSDMMYPDELLEWTPPTRLANLLNIEREAHSAPFFDFLKIRDETIARLLTRKNCGQRSIGHLDKIISRLLRTRLSACGADEQLEPYLRDLMRGNIPPLHILATIAEIETVHPDRTAFPALVENHNLSDILSALLPLLGARQHDILTRRYGIGTGRPETLAMLAACYDLTRERVRQIERTALNKIATRRVADRLVTVLKRENTLEKFFKNRKIIVKEQIKAVRKTLNPEERLGIDVAYGTASAFLDAESIRTKVGWVQDHDLDLADQEPDTLSRTLKTRIVSAIRKLHLPIRLSEISSAIPDYPDSIIKTVLVENLGATFTGDITGPIPNLPVRVQCILILRDAGHALHCEEILKKMRNIFKTDGTIGQVRGTLTNLPDALIVDRGVYDLHENLDLTQDDLTEIRNRTYDHLKTAGQFTSAKVLFSHLFNGDVRRFGSAFGPYMLLGILQSDRRFKTKKGLMVGLASQSGKTEFRSLGDDILTVLSESGRAMRLAEIADKLKDNRDVTAASISTRIRTIPEIISIGRGLVDLETRAIENNHRSIDVSY